MFLQRCLNFPVMIQFSHVCFMAVHKNACCFTEKRLQTDLIFKAISRMTLGTRSFQSWSIGKNYRVCVNSNIVYNLWPHPRASNDGSTWCLKCPLLLFICGTLQEASWSFLAVSRSSHSHTRQPGSLFSNTHTSWAPASTFRKFQSKGGEKSRRSSETYSVTAELFCSHLMEQ